MAGESARRVAQRDRERAAELERQAGRWEQGAVGEEWTAQVLDELPDDSWVVLHDVPWPGRPKANIDHVAVGPTGIYVIDTKNWSGHVRVRGGQLLQNGRRRTSTVESASRAAADVATLPGLPRVPVRAVLCFHAGSGGAVPEEPEAVTGPAGDVIVCGGDDLISVLQVGPPVLVAARVRPVADGLRTALAASRALPRYPAAPVPVTRARSRRPARATRPRRRLPVPRILGAGTFLVVLFTQPELITEAAAAFGEWFAERIAESTAATDPN